MLVFTGSYLCKMVLGLRRPVNPPVRLSKEGLEQEGLLAGVGSLLGRALLGPSVSGILGS